MPEKDPDAQRPGDPNGVVLYRLQAVEKRIEHLDGEITRRLDSIQSTIGTLAFVSKEVYMSERDALRERIDSTRAIAMWALGMTVSAAIGALFMLLRLAAA